MASTVIDTDFAGRRGRLFWLALKTSVMTVLTLGVYRFWMKTRLRRYYWSSIRPGGVPLEYTGRPLEKLLGFLIAVVFLAFYIGIFNLILVFLSFSFLQDNFAAYILSFVVVIPFLFYAQYRARRYLLARTRWRGLRFGLEPGAWAYSWRAALHWLATILTAGLLWPRMTFWLEKFRTDRTHFGSARLTQGGTWTMLYRPFLPLLFGVALTGAGIVNATYSGGPGAWLFLPGLPLIFYGFVHYRVRCFKILTDHKTAGPIGFLASPRPRRVLGIYIFGSLLIFIVLFVLLVGLFMAIAAMLSSNVIGRDVFDLIPDLMESLPTWASAAIAILFYFNFFIFWGVLTQVFLTLPLMRHYAETLEVTGAPHLTEIGQRDRDEFAEAEGFAEALDVGAAI